jgi:hypothetical protein
MAIQPLQGGLRAQLSDACSRAQQPAAMALAGIVVSASNVASYLMALMDLPQVFSLGGSSQFSILCVMTSVILALTVTLTCLGVREGRDYTVQRNQGVSEGAISKFLCLATSLSRLPRQVRQVYKVQFLAWMAWFPFLFYMTTHIAGICKPASMIDNARCSSVCANSALSRSAAYPRRIHLERGSTGEINEDRVAGPPALRSRGTRFRYCSTAGTSTCERWCAKHGEHVFFHQNYQELDRQHPPTLACISSPLRGLHVRCILCDLTRMCVHSRWSVWHQLGSHNLGTMGNHQCSRLLRH